MPTRHRSAISSSDATDGHGASRDRWRHVTDGVLFCQRYTSHRRRAPPASVSEPKASLGQWVAWVCKAESVLFTYNLFPVLVGNVHEEGSVCTRTRQREQLWSMDSLDWRASFRVSACVACRVCGEHMYVCKRVQMMCALRKRGRQLSASHLCLNSHRKRGSSRACASSSRSRTQRR